MPPPMLRTANHPFVPGTSRKYLLLLFPCICPACTLFFFFPVLVQYVPCSSFFLYLSSMCHPLLFSLYQSSVYPVLSSFSMYLTNVYLVLLPCTCLVCTLIFFFHVPVQCVPSSSFSTHLSCVSSVLHIYRSVYIFTTQSPQSYHQVLFKHTPFPETVY